MTSWGGDLPRNSLTKVLWAQMTVFGLKIFICEVWGELCLDVAHTYILADLNIHRYTHVHTSTSSLHLLPKYVVSNQ